MVERVEVGDDGWGSESEEEEGGGRTSSSSLSHLRQDAQMPVPASARLNDCDRVASKGKRLWNEWREVASWGEWNDWSKEIVRECIARSRGIGDGRAQPWWVSCDARPIE